jgi:hypothetical protein
MHIYKASPLEVAGSTVLGSDEDIGRSLPPDMATHHDKSSPLPQLKVVAPSRSPVSKHPKATLKQLDATESIPAHLLTLHLVSC